MPVLPANVLKGPGWSVTWTVYQAGIDGASYTLPVKAWNINRSRREPLDWSITLPFSRLYRPRGAVGKLLQPEPYDSTWGLRRYLRCVIRVGGATYTSPKMVLKTYRVGLQKGNRLVTVSGSDRTEALLEEDVIEDDVRSKPDALIGCKTVFGETLMNQGIGSYSLTFTDFYVKVFHRNGVPLQYLRELMETFQGVFRWEDDTLVIGAGGRSVGGETADYSLTAGSNIVVLDYQKDQGEACNEITIERATELASGLNEPVKGKALGPVTISLDKPAFYAEIRIELKQQGYTGDWLWDDADGNPLTGAPTKVFTGEATRAAQVRFNIYPPVGSGSTDEIEYTVWILVDNNHQPEFGDYTSEVFATAKSDFDQGHRGKKKLPQPLTMQHVPNQTVCQSAADLKLEEELRKYKSVQIQAPLDPGVRPDLVAAVTAPDFDLVAHNMMTETVAFSGTEKGVFMTVGLSRELTAEDVAE